MCILCALFAYDAAFYGVDGYYGATETVIYNNIERLLYVVIFSLLLRSLISGQLSTIAEISVALLFVCRTILLILPYCDKIKLNVDVRARVTEMSTEIQQLIGAIKEDRENTQRALTKMEQSIVKMSESFTLFYQHIATVENERKNTDQFKKETREFQEYAKPILAKS